MVGSDRGTAAELDQLGRTALVPFWARVRDAMQDEPVLGDSAAVAIAPMVAARFGVTRVPVQTQVGCCLRNRIADQWIADMVGAGCRIVIHIGVGLDTRFRRLSFDALRYVEVDQGPIIRLRDRWLPDPRVVRISADGMDVQEWAGAVDLPPSHVLLVLEGVLPYQKPARVSEFLSAAAGVLPGGYVLFDSVSPLGAWLANRPAVRAGGRPRYTWSRWRTGSIRAGGHRLHILKETGFTELPRGLAGLFSVRSRLVHSVRPMRRSYRITLARLPGLDGRAP